MLEYDSITEDFGSAGIWRRVHISILNEVIRVALIEEVRPPDRRLVQRSCGAIKPGVFVFGEQ